MKYIDLHLHLDGAITVKIARKLAIISKVNLPESDDELSALLRVKKDCRDLNEFLKCFETPLRLMQTRESLREAAYLVLEDMKAQGLEYVELRFAPELHLEKGLTIKEVVLAVLEGMRKSSLPSNLILCAMRGDGNEDANKLTVEVAGELLNVGAEPRVVAVDIAGAEGLYPTSKFKYVFDEAKQLNVPFTIHAGEADGPESIRCAIAFGAKRIGHGVNARFDEKIMAELSQKGILLEMCPSSNLLTGAVTKIGDFPIRRFIEAKIPVAICTDDPAIIGTTIKEEFELLKAELKLTENEIDAIYRNTIDASFASEATKDRLRK